MSTVKFHEWRTLFEQRRGWGLDADGWRGFYDKYGPRWLAASIRAPVSSDPLHLIVQIVNLEKSWYESMRPYYKVWPSVVPALCRLNLSMKPSDLRVEQTRKWKTICVRFPVGHEASAGGTCIRSMLCAVHNMQFRGEAAMTIAGEAEPPPRRCLCLCTNASLTQSPQSLKQGFVVIDFDSELDMTMEDLIHSQTELSPMSAEVAGKAVKVALTVNLLANDPSIIEPDVLKADRQKYNETHDPKYVAKAKRRGVVGWKIGESYESTPHYRRPHFGLRWTGKGRGVPRIVPVKGSVVHRKKIAQVPTGYITPDGVEVEP